MPSPAAKHKVRVPLAPYVMIAPAQLLLFGLIFVPSIYVAWLSLQEWTFGQTAEFVGFDNYLALFGDRNFWRALLNTFVVVNIVVYGELILGMALALLFAGGVPMRRVMVSIVLMPYAISEVVAVVMWKYMLEPDIGIVQNLLTGIGLGELEWSIDPVAALAVIIMLSIWLHLPFTFIILYTARLGIPKELYEAARIDGANSWQAFTRITVRLLLPAILVALLFRYIFAFRIFSEVWLLTGGGPARTTEVIAIYLYRSAFRYHEFGMAAATGWAMVLLSFLLALYYLRVMYKRMFAGEP